MPMIHTRFRFRSAALCPRTLICYFPWKSSVFHFHAALVWLLQLRGGITQSNLTTASRKDRIIIFILPLTTLSSKPIVREQGRLVESSDDMLWSWQHTRTEKRFRGGCYKTKVCESSAWGTQAQVTKLFPMTFHPWRASDKCFIKVKHSAVRFFMNSMFVEVVKSRFKYYWPQPNTKISFCSEKSPRRRSDGRSHGFWQWNRLDSWHSLPTFFSIMDSAKRA